MMKLYLLFLLAIIVTCQANELSWSRQLNDYSGHRKNDLYQEAYLDEGDGRSDVRTPSTLDVGKLPKSSQIPNDRRLSPNKGSDVARASGQAQGVPNKNHKATFTREHKVDKDTIVWKQAHFEDAASDGHVVRQTRNLPLGVSGVNQATFVSRTNNLGQGANVLRSSDLNRAKSYGQENYLNRADGLSQADYARRNLDSPVSVAKAGNYLNNVDSVAQGLNVESTSYFDSSAPIVRAGNSPKFNWIYKPPPDVTKNEPKNDISTSDSIRPEAQRSQHGYSHPDPEIERKQREQYVPSVLDIAERGAIEDSKNNDLDNTYNTKGINLPSFDPSDDYSLLSDTYGNPNDGYDSPYDGYGIHEGSEISNQGPNNGYDGFDHKMLAPNFDIFRESDINSITKNKITTSPLIAAYNDSTDQNIYNNTDQKTISDRGGFFDADNGYTLDHHGFHNTGTLFSDDSTKNDGFPDVVEISSNNAPMNSNGECYCSTNNGHRVCNCDPNHCEGANCQRVVTQSQTTTTTTCELCKVRETTTPNPFVCDLCTQPPPPPPPPPPSPPPPPPRCDCHCEPCRPKCDPCKQRESSCECKQSCSCGCSCCKSESSCCKHSSSSCCKHSCPSCKPKKSSCSTCESGQDFGNNYEDNGNNYYGENGINYYGENANNYYGDSGNSAYNDYYNKYYKNQAAAAFGGSSGGQLHANVQGNAFAGAYGDGGGQITDRGKSVIDQYGSSGGTVALYADTDSDDDHISNSKSSNAGGSISSVVGSSKTKISGSSSIKSSGGSIKSISGSVKTSGGKSSSSSSAYSVAYGGSSGNPYNHLLSRFSKTGIFPNNAMISPFGR